MSLRILLCIEPRMLAELIRDELGSGSDIQVRMGDTRQALSAVAAEFEPDVVIANITGGALAGEMQQFLAGRTDLLVVGVEAHDDRHPVTLFTEGAGMALGELAPGQLLPAIRSRVLGRA